MNKYISENVVSQTLQCTECFDGPATFLVAGSTWYMWKLKIERLGFVGRFGVLFRGRRVGSFTSTYLIEQERVRLNWHAEEQQVDNEY